jgi:hypothetical protein
MGRESDSGVKLRGRELLQKSHGVVQGITLPFFDEAAAFSYLLLRLLLILLVAVRSDSSKRDPPAI